jgi:trans-aconitate methyltransferase
LSKTTTLTPDLTRLLTKWLPIKPAPPVTRTDFIVWIYGGLMPKCTFAKILNIGKMDLRESSHRNSSPAFRHPWELARLEVVSRLVRKYAGSKPGNILDLGCGDLFFIKEFKKKFPDGSAVAVDIEFSDSLLESEKQTLEILGISAFKTLDQAQENFKEKVNLVLLLDVIEHIEDDIGFLKMLESFSFISKDALVVITVPAYQALFCSHDRFLGHYRRYNNKMLEAHISRAGFQPIKTGYFFHSLLYPRALQVTREKFFPPGKETTGLVEWGGGKVKTNLIKNVLVGDFAFSFSLGTLGIKIPGLSNYILCKRPE